MKDVSGSFWIIGEPGAHARVRIGVLGDVADDGSSYSRAHHTVLFNIFVLSQLVNEINSRKVRPEINVILAGTLVSFTRTGMRWARRTQEKVGSTVGRRLPESLRVESLMP